MAICTCNLGGLCDWIVGLTVLSVFSTTLIFIAELAVGEEAKVSTNTTDVPAVEYQGNMSAVQSLSSIGELAGALALILIVVVLCKYKEHAGMKKHRKLFVGSICYIVAAKVLPQLAGRSPVLRLLRIGNLVAPLAIVYAARSIKKEFAAADGERVYALFGNPLLDGRQVVPTANAAQAAQPAAAEEGAVRQLELVVR